MKWFKKFGSNVPLFLSSGARVVFERVDGGWGVLAAADPVTVAEIGAMISQGRGGVSEIDQAEYDGLKKKPISIPPWRQEIGKHEIAQQAQRLRQGTEAAPGVAVAAEPARSQVHMGGAQTVFRPMARKAS